MPGTSSEMAAPMPLILFFTHKWDFFASFLTLVYLHILTFHISTTVVLPFISRMLCHTSPEE